MKLHSLKGGLAIKDCFPFESSFRVMVLCGLLGAAPLASGFGDEAGNSHRPMDDPVLASIQTLPTLTEVPFISPEPASCPTTSHPFSTMLCSLGPSMNYDADGSNPVDLKRDWGYTEKEFFQAGTANVYDLGANERAVVRSSGHPYTTRLLVRYPTHPARFSGRVYIEILNASNNYDIENTWRRSWQHLMKSGDAYIGITSKSVCAKALKKFDPDRYAALNWQVDGMDENGLFWDMLSQLGAYLRRPGASHGPAGGLLGHLHPRYVYLTGESQSGMYMNTYLTAFSDRVEKAGPGFKPLFDGYLNGVGPSFIFLRSESAPPYSSVPTKLYRPTKVPHIVYMSENESRMYDALKDGVPGVFPPGLPYFRRADSSTATDQFRFYEYPGTPHTDPLSQVLPINAEIKKAGGNPRSTPPYYTGTEHDDLQLTEFVHALQESLHDWAAKKMPAPVADAKWMLYHTATDDRGNTVYDPQRDELGNALGGVRSPMIEAPLHRFYGQGKTGPNTYIANSWGSMEKLDDTVINGLYAGSCSNYLARFNAAANALVKGRYLVKSDADSLKAWAITKGNTVLWGNGKRCD